jgi:CHASE3 domain sensor protein
MMKLRGKRGLALLLIMPVLLTVELAIGWGIFTNVRQNTVIDANIDKLDQYLVSNTRYVTGGESAQRGYLLSGDPKFYETYVADIREWVKNEDYYRTLPNEIKQKEVDDIERFSRQEISDMDLAVHLYNKGDTLAAVALVKAGYNNGLIDSIRTKSTRLRNETGNAVVTLKHREYRLIYAFFILISVLIVFSLILAWLTYIAFRDYTKNLETTVKSLEEANETLLEYNYNSYHSLKTPLRNIIGFMQLIEKKYSEQFDAEAKEYVHFIGDGIKQLNTIIVDMRRKFLESRGEEDERE